MTHARAEQINDNGRETISFISRPVIPDKPDATFSGTTLSCFEGNAVVKDVALEGVHFKDKNQIPYENKHLTCLFDEEEARILLRSVIARILEFRDAKEYYVKDDCHGKLASLRRVPTDIHLFGMICLPLQWKGVFKRKTSLANMLEQLQIMFQELEIWVKYTPEKVASGWEREKSRFLGKEVDKDNYLDIISKLPKKRKEDGELFRELVNYIFESIDNLQNKYNK